MTPSSLKLRVQDRDRLVLQAEHAEAELQNVLRGALANGDLARAEAAVTRHELRLRELTENLRIYQAELHAQADELAAAQQRNSELLTRFAALFTAMPVAALRVGFNGELLEHNGRAAALFGLGRGPGAGASSRFLHRMVNALDWQERVRPALHRAREQGADALEGVHFSTEDGRGFVGELHIAALPATGGDTRGGAQFLCAVVDRTEQLAALQALRRSEASLAASARLARLGGWSLLLQPQRALHFSGELRALLELPDETPATLETLLAHCSAHDRGVFAALVAAAELGEPFEVELDMLSARGHPLRMLAAGQPERDDAGTVSGVGGVFQDISVQAEARHRIEDLTERLSLAHDAGGIGVWDWNPAERTLLLDARLQALLGGVRPEADDLVSALAPVLRGDDALLLSAALERTLRQGEPLNLELRRAPAADDDGGGSGERWLHVTGRAHFAPDGQAQRVVGCAWDSSPEHEAARLRAAKDAAESASRAKSAFLSRMSHELRTPLNAILGFSQLMRMEAEGGDLVLKPHRVTLIETAARHLLDLVNEVLDVTRIESGQLEVKLTRFALHEVVAEALPLVQGQAATAGIALHDHLAAAAPCEVLADRLRLKEVLINLLSNAVKYNRRDGSVDVTAEALGDAVELVVADTGHGMDSAQRAQLFQPFNRLGAEASGVQGSGLGLFVSRRFVELMGGSIAVDSEPGVGTRFRVRLNAPRQG